jgi:myo-inositol 2-dehydrogenase/D-chiro-inositol 1-dehydrogenase
MTQGSDNRPLRLGIVGCGKVVEKYHLPALRRSKAWTLAAACDPSPERRRWVQNAMPGLAVFERHGDLLNKMPLDAVLVATPPATHFALSVQALEAGLHVLVEKPMSLNVEDAQRMVESATSERKLLLVGFNRRFHPTYTRLYAQLQGSNISNVSSRFIFDARAWGAHLGDDAAGGGVLDDVVCHQADLLGWLLGRRAARVRAVSATKDGKEAGAIKYELDFCGGLVAQCTAGHGTTYHEEVRIDVEGKTLVAGPGAGLGGEAGGVLMSLWDATEAAISKAARKVSGRPSVTVESFDGQLEAFAWGVRAGAPHEQSADALSGLHSARVVAAARESLRSGGEWQQIASTMGTGTGMGMGTRMGSEE